jgi:hypothetical protein
MSQPIPSGIAARPNMVIAAIEFALPMGSVALYLTTYEISGVVAAALIGFAMFATVAIHPAAEGRR